MPNLKKHVTVGAVVGGGLNLVWQLYKIHDLPNPPEGFWDTISRINFVEVAAFAAVGAAFGALPDLIEPATTPNHRAVFHSVVCAGVVTYAGLGNHTDDLIPSKRHLLRVVTLSYLSHLFLDGQTPKGLPLLGLKAPKFG
jgi:membrane-bound metal-dependent hydrolase YbcI (DUF457 family)